MNELLNTLRALRAPDGCPWDIKQTHESLRPHLIEEAAEAVEALGQPNESHRVEELGDVLLHVAFHAVIAEERDAWNFSDVERAIVAKLIRRHPHVFGDVQVDGEEGVKRNWEAIKAAERRERGEDRDPDAFPPNLPALSRARTLAKRQPDRADDALQAAANGSGDAAVLLDAMVALTGRLKELGVDAEVALRDHVGERLREASKEGA